MHTPRRGCGLIETALVKCRRGKQKQRSEGGCNWYRRNNEEHEGLLVITHLFQIRQTLGLGNFSVGLVSAILCSVVELPKYASGRSPVYFIFFPAQLREKASLGEDMQVANSIYTHPDMNYDVLYWELDCWRWRCEAIADAGQDILLARGLSLLLYAGKYLRYVALVYVTAEVGELGSAERFIKSD